MLPQIITTTNTEQNISKAVLLDGLDDIHFKHLTEAEHKYLTNKLEKENHWVLYQPPLLNFFYKADTSIKPAYYKLENARQAGSKLYDLVKHEKVTSLEITGKTGPEITLAFLEGILLSCYKFEKYKKEKDNFKLGKIRIIDNHVNAEQIHELTQLVKAVFFARDMVNEPLSYLTAERLSNEIESIGVKSGINVEILNKGRIEALRMGGLLAVNKGSIDPPTFTVLEWKPEQPVNDTPIVLVGKGVVYDTGGLSLKPTPKSMDYMKCDMAGGAITAAVIYAAALNKLPVHIVGLIPATDNRPDGNAYVPGDIITMYDGTTVEVRNTDAEGRLLLADALSYARQYNPKLVIDIATLTGSAEIITGQHAMVAMGNAEQTLQKIKSIGEQQFERLLEVPLWKEYAKPLESKVADLNNLGSREAQTTIAGKFLEHFTDYPWIHLDIAGVAFFHDKSNYYPAGGTGIGVRLLYHFLKIFN